MKFTIPNQLTLIRIILAPVFIILFLQPDNSSRMIASIVFVLASFTDWYDGYFARRYNLTSRWGQFMDPLADKVLVSSALVVFAYQEYLYWWMVLIVIFRDFSITFLRSFAIYIGKPIITRGFAKWKTFLQMGFIFSLIIYLNIPGVSEIRLSHVENPWYLWTTITFFILVLFTVYSGLDYIIVNSSHVIELFKRSFRKTAAFVMTIGKVRLLYYILGSGFGSGYFPIAPGTAGSIVGLLIFFLMPIGLHYWLIIICLFFILGVWAATQIEREKGHDPGLVVVDEMVGQWIALLFIPVTLFHYAAAFILFRFFDILKPFPINRSQNLKEGWGIMIDDVLAGVYANLLLQIFRFSGIFQ